MASEQGGRTVEEAMRMEDMGLKRSVTRDQNRAKRADTNETKRQPLTKRVSEQKKEVKAG